MLDRLKPDILRLIELNGEISRYSQMMLHHNDMCDKRNYDSDKCVKIKKLISELQDEFYKIKEFWGL